MTHRSFKQCLDDADPCFSWFDGDGSAYCHHCKTTHLEARAKASHARSSTMEKPDVAQQPETAASKPLP